MNKSPDSNTYRSSQAPEDGLVERLRAKVPSGRFAMGGGTIDATGKGTSWGGEPIMVYRNPDGPQAANEILILRSRCDGMKEALEEACELIQDMIKYKYRIDDGRAFLAKAALGEGKK